MLEYEVLDCPAKVAIASGTLLSEFAALAGKVDFNMTLPQSGGLRMGSLYMCRRPPRPLAHAKVILPCLGPVRSLGGSS